MPIFHELSRYFRYCKDRCRIVRISDGKIFSPTDEGAAVLLEPSCKYRKRMKYSIACWVLGNKKDVPEGHKIVHINLDSFDFRLKNLKCISNDAVLKVQEAKRNMQGRLKLRSHPVDMYAYLVQYVEDGKSKTECFYDIAQANKRFKQLQLKYSKIISKYHNSEF